MTTGNFILLVTEIATLIGVVMAIVAASQARRDARETKQKVHEIHIDINSNLTEYKKLMERAAFAEGRKAERDNPEP